MDGGPETGIHKSTDGGYTWRELTEGSAQREHGENRHSHFSDQSRRSSMRRSNSSNVRVASGKSEDGGETWEKQSDYVAGGTGPHYYQEIFASPHMSSITCITLDVRLHVSESTVARPLSRQRNSLNKHGDHHAVAFDLRR